VRKGGILTESRSRIYAPLVVLSLMVGLLAGCQTDHRGVSKPTVSAPVDTSASEMQDKAQQALKDGPLHAVLDGLKASAAKDPYMQVYSSIAAAPQLVVQLNDLAQSGLLAGIDIGNVKKMNFLGAYLDGKRMVFTPDYLKALAQTEPAHVRPPDAIIPNNLAFVMGHLAYHMGKTGPATTSFNNPMAFAQAKIADEAAADIQGWNDVIDAAEKENGNKQLSVPQVGFLIVSLRYRAVFMKASQSSQNLEYSQSGRIEPTQQNLAAMAVALSSTNIRDYE
jgi:hypothetical protein